MEGSEVGGGSWLAISPYLAPHPCPSCGPAVWSPSRERVGERGSSSLPPLGLGRPGQVPQAGQQVYIVLSLPGAEVKLALKVS